MPSMQSKGKNKKQPDVDHAKRASENEGLLGSNASLNGGDPRESKMHQGVQNDLTKVGTFVYKPNPKIEGLLDEFCSKVTYFRRPKTPF